MVNRHQGIPQLHLTAPTNRTYRALQLSKLNIAPPLGPVHIDDPLGGPDPVILTQLGYFLVRPIDHLVFPLDPREVKPPAVTGLRRHGGTFSSRHRRPGNCHFY